MGIAGWHDQVPGRQGHHVLRHVPVLERDLEDTEPAIAQGVHGRQRRLPEADHGQVAVHDAQHAIQVDRTVGQLHAHDLVIAHLAQRPLHLVGSGGVGAHPLGQHGHLGIHQDHVRPFERTLAMDGHQHRHTQPAQRLGHKPLLATPLLRSGPGDDGPFGCHQHQVANKVGVGLVEPAVLHIVNRHAMLAVDAGQRVVLGSSQVRVVHPLHPQRSVGIGHLVDLGPGVPQ